MKNQLEKDIYETPIVEIIEVEIEKGFAASNPNGGIQDLEQDTW